MNLKKMCYFLRYRTNKSRPTVANDILLDAVNALQHHRRSEIEHVDGELPEINFKDWPTSIESVRSYYRTILGTTKIPLAYAIRDDEEVPDAAEDPPENYDTIEDELIARGPTCNNQGNFTQTFHADRGRVWDKLFEMLRGTDAFSYIRPYQATRDGRGAFLALVRHFPGPNHANNMAAAAEAILNTSTFKGDSRGWTIERYAKIISTSIRSLMASPPEASTVV